MVETKKGREWFRSKSLEVVLASGLEYLISRIAIFKGFFYFTWTVKLAEREGEGEAEIEIF